MMKLYYKLLGALMLCALIVGCSDLIEPEHPNGDDVAPGYNDPVILSYDDFSIKPLRMDVEGVSSLVVSANSATRSEEVISTDAEMTMYCLDEAGNIKLTLFYYDVVYVGSNPDITLPDEGDAGAGEEGAGQTIEAFVDTLKMELTDAVQLVPELITDLHKYILFSGCKYEINNMALSEKAMDICQMFVNLQNSSDYNRTFLVRKSDGALFEVTGFNVLCYLGKDSITDYTVYRRWYFSGSAVARDSFAVSADGHVFVLGPGGIYQIVDKGDTVEFRQIRTSEFDAFVMSDFGDVALYNHHLNRAGTIEWFTPSNELCVLDWDNWKSAGDVIDVILQPNEENTGVANLLVLIYEDIYGELNLSQNVPFQSTANVSTIEVGRHATITKLSVTNGLTWHLDERYMVILETQMQLVGLDAEKGLYVIATTNLQHDFFFQWSDTEFYGVNIDGGALKLTKYDHNLEVIKEEIVELGLSDSFDLEFSFEGQCLILQGRYRVGGDRWRKEYNPATGELTNQQQNTSLNVVTFFKLN